VKAFLNKLVDLLPRPLDPIRSIKLKLAILLTCSGGVAFAFFNYRIGWLPPATTGTAIVLALITSQILAHGMTRPLREMTAAARTMARGDYTRRIRATARDEVGELAHAFNQMAADLDATAPRAATCTSSPKQARTTSLSRSATRAPASQPKNAAGSSNASPAVSEPVVAAPGWGWPSPAGWSTCTAAPSASSCQGSCPPTNPRAAASAWYCQLADASRAPARTLDPGDTHA